MKKFLAIVALAAVCLAASADNADAAKARGRFRGRGLFGALLGLYGGGGAIGGGIVQQPPVVVVPQAIQQQAAPCIQQQAAFVQEMFLVPQFIGGSGLLVEERLLGRGFRGRFRR